MRSLPATPNQFLGGPTSGTSSSPGTFRSLVVADLPSTVYGTQSANVVYAGPTTGAAAAPTFRALVLADLPTAASVAANTIYAGPTSGSNATPAFRTAVFNDLPVTLARIDVNVALYCGAL